MSEPKDLVREIEGAIDKISKSIARANERRSDVMYFERCVACELRDTLSRARDEIGAGRAVLVKIHPLVERASELFNYDDTLEQAGCVELAELLLDIRFELRQALNINPETWDGKYRFDTPPKEGD